MFKTLTAVIFTFLLVAGVPALSYSTGRNRELPGLPRMTLYLSAVLSQWILTGAALAVVFLVARRVFKQAFAPIPLGLIMDWAIGIAAVAVVSLSLVILCERRGWLPRESELVYHLIPKTPREKLWAAFMVAPTAAFCEEFLFRGFLLTQLHDWLHSLLWAWALSSLAFGWAHCYQGWSGMTRAALLGALLAYPVVCTGSLYPAMLAHWIIDAAALLWLGPWMIGKGTRFEESTVE